MRTRRAPVVLDRSNPGRRSWARRRHGVGFLWFSLVAIPALFFASAMAVDLTWIYVANRQTRTAAEAAAVAGAFEFERTPALAGDARLDPDVATDVATETFDANVDAGAARFATVADRTAEATESSVTVDVASSPSELVFFHYFIDEDAAFTVSQTADVCVPGEYEPTGGACRRPG